MPEIIQLLGDVYAFIAFTCPGTRAKWPLSSTGTPWLLPKPPHVKSSTGLPTRVRLILIIGRFDFDCGVMSVIFLIDMDIVAKT